MSKRTIDRGGTVADDAGETSVSRDKRWRRSHSVAWTGGPGDDGDSDEEYRFPEGTRARRAVAKGGDDAERQEVRAFHELPASVQGKFRKSMVSVKNRGHGRVSQDSLGGEETERRMLDQSLYAVLHLKHTRNPPLGWELPESHENPFGGLNAWKRMCLCRLESYELHESFLSIRTVMEASGGTGGTGGTGGGSFLLGDFLNEMMDWIHVGLHGVAVEESGERGLIGCVFPMNVTCRYYACDVFRAESPNEFASLVRRLREETADESPDYLGKGSVPPSSSSSGLRMVHMDHLFSEDAERTAGDSGFRPSMREEFKRLRATLACHFYVSCPC